MTWRRIGSAEHRHMPWKNGGGSTAEIAIHPESAAVGGGFDWRISIASIGQDGPFSAFPGYDRVIMLLRGNGAVLTVAGAPAHRLDAPFAPYPFLGEATTDCRLIDGPCEDFNLMVRRDRFRHAVAMWSPGQPPPDGLAAARILFLCRGAATATLDGGQKAVLGARDTLVLDGETPQRVEGGTDALIFWATIAAR